MDPIKETAAAIETKPAGEGLPNGTDVAASHVEPGTENAAHTGHIEPHSPAANALPNGGASGVIHTEAVGTATVGSKPVELPINANVESVHEDLALPKNQHPNDVKFKVKYAANFKGEKTFEEGSVQVISKESAAQFTKLGIGSIIK